MNQNISHLFGAVDGGGTGCRVRLALGDGVPLAQATGGPANYTTDAAQAVSNITDALTRATAQLSCPQQICALHVGLAGILTQDDARDMAARLGFDHCTVSDDRLTTAVGALGDRDGAVLALGTGGFSALRRDGNLRFIGGWGLKVGDQASGAWLGRAVLEHTLLAHDGLAPHSDLTQHILARFGTPACGPGGTGRICHPCTGLN